MSRFADLGEDDLDALLENRTSKNTKAAVKQGKHLFLEFLQKKGKTESDIDGMVENELDQLLKEFFPSIRKKMEN